MSGSNPQFSKTAANLLSSDNSDHHTIVPVTASKLPCQI
jgi:hypothetical protein